MPEGPEVKALEMALARCGVPSRARAKALLVGGKRFTFGLFGRVRLVRDEGAGELRVIKVATPRVPCGDVVDAVDAGPRDDGEGKDDAIDWVSASREQLRAATAQWATRSKCLAALLLEQTPIAGIGLAWGCEILHAAGGLQPGVAANKQDLRRLVDAMCTVRDAAMACYTAAVASAADPVELVNGWFKNLYASRADLMRVYGKGSTQVRVGGRAWWVA
jgi:hypothetical protein